MNPDFEVLLKEAGDLEARKRADYGRPDDKYANYRASEAWGIPAWVNAALRMDEKMTRLQSFVLKGRLENESVEDGLLDIAVGALIALDLFRQASPAGAPLSEEALTRAIEALSPQQIWDMTASGIKSGIK